MQKTCAQCSTVFEITKDDLAFLDRIAPLFGGKKYGISPPTHCPDCRTQRRFSFRNERHFYRRKSDMSGMEIVSNFSPFEQFDELQREVPQLAASIGNSENSSFCNYVGHVKNCYLIFGSVYSENCYYGSPYYSHNCIDTLVVRECEECYECTDCRKLHSCFYCQD